MRGFNTVLVSSNKRKSHVTFTRISAVHRASKVGPRQDGEAVISVESQRKFFIINRGGKQDIKSALWMLQRVVGLKHRQHSLELVAILGAVGDDMLLICPGYRARALMMKRHRTAVIGSIL